jgi:hypothetical protein
MRESTPIFDERDLRDVEARAAEAATDIGADDPDDLTLPMWEVIRTLLLAIVVVATTALIAALV